MYDLNKKLLKVTFREEDETEYTGCFFNEKEINNFLTDDETLQIISVSSITLKELINSDEFEHPYKVEMVATALLPKRVSKAMKKYWVMEEMLISLGIEI